MSTAPFPRKVSSKALAKAKAWLETRRQETAASQERNQELSQALLGGIAETLGDLGVNAIQVGNTRIQLSEVPTAKPSVSERWSAHLASGGKVFVLEINSNNVGFAGKEKVDPEKRSLDVLIDVDLVRKLAPSVTIYGPGEESPWPALLPKNGFQLWLTSGKELKSLWAGIRTWLKTQWHDDVMAKCRFFHTFESVATVSLSQVLEPDLDLRIARMERAERILEQASEEGADDRQAQSDLKRAIGSLVALENHSVAGAAATSAIEALLPALAFAMDAKNIYQTLVKQDLQARTAAHEAIKSVSFGLDECPDRLPSLDGEGESPDGYSL